jgi:hypothetical protein
VTRAPRLFAVAVLAVALAVSGAACRSGDSGVIERPATTSTSAP